jgi:4-amino-4-deoxy-L-arabinose transferase-like glycosyltransferase
MMAEGKFHAGRWLGAAILVGAVLRVWGLWFGLPHAQARPDEVEAVSHALRIAQGDLNPHFFNWPSLHLYILAFLFRTGVIPTGVPGLAGAAPAFEQLVPIGRAYVAVAGILTIPALFLLARRAAGPVVAVGAAALLAVAPLHVRDSHFATTDVTMTLLVTLSIWLLAEAHARLAHERSAPDALRRGLGLRFMAAAGLLGGLAAGTKYSAAAVLAAAAVSQLALAAAAPSWRRPSAWTPLAVFLAGSAAGFVAATPYAVLDFATFRADLLFEFAHLSGGHGSQLGRGWTRHVAFSLPLGLGVGTFVAACAGTVVALRRGGTTLRLIIAFAAAVYVSIGSGYTVFARYALPLLPVGCLLAALAVESVSRLRGRFAAAADAGLDALARGAGPVASRGACVAVQALFELGR